MVNPVLLAWSFLQGWMLTRVETRAWRELLVCITKASDAPGETLEMTSPEINSQQREDPFSRRVSSSASSGPHRDPKSSLENTVPVTDSRCRALNSTRPGSEPLGQSTSLTPQRTSVANPRVPSTEASGDRERCEGNPSVHPPPGISALVHAPRRIRIAPCRSDNLPGRLALPNRTASSTTTTTRLANDRPPTPYLATPTLPPLKVLTYLPLSATAPRASSLVSISRLSLSPRYSTDPFHSSSGTSFGLHTALG